MQKLVDVSKKICGFERMYRDTFHIRPAFNGVTIPKLSLGVGRIGRLLILAPGMGADRLYWKCNNLFPCGGLQYGYLDENVRSERTTDNGAYAVWVLNCRDAVEQDCSPGITLPERLLLEIVYFLETGGHLDIETETLCGGSRFIGGDIPTVYWSGGCLEIGKRHPDFTYPGLRCREVIC